MSLSQEIKHKALELGFDLVGITNASPLNTELVEMFTDWLKSGCAGQMSYLHRNFEKRTQPAKLLENAQSIICVGLNYKPPKQKPKPPDATTSIGKVANYAQYEDYHPFIKEQLRKLTEFISSAAVRWSATPWARVSWIAESFVSCSLLPDRTWSPKALCSRACSYS